MNVIIWVACTSFVHPTTPMFYLDLLKYQVYKGCTTRWIWKIEGFSPFFNVELMLGFHL